MTADERIALVLFKVERAKQHIINLQVAIDAFLDTKPYGVIKKIDSDSGKMRYEISKISPIPGNITAIAGDIFQNLRSSLDHLTYQLLLVKLGVTVTDEEFKFPCFNSAKAHKTFFEGKKQKIKVRPDAFAALRNIHAYKGGNGHQFWVLNLLNNIDKHRMVLAVGSGSHSVNIGAAMANRANAFRPDRNIPAIDIFVAPADNLCPLEVGDVLVDGLSLDMEMNEDGDFRFSIALNEPEIAESEPLIETVQQLCDLVTNTIGLFKPFLN